MTGKQPDSGRVQRRKDAVFALAILAGIVSFVLLVLWIQGLAEDLRTANTARDALARQVQQLGGTPVAGAPGSRGEVGPTGPRGPRGPAGSRGEDGSRGSDGERGPSGSAGRAGDRGESGPSGAPGVAGADGRQGEPGADGRAGSPGAQGEPGPQGPAGEQGPRGERGEQGERGETGSPGPAPSGWTFTYRDTTYECTPDGDGSGHYTCRATSGPEDPSLLGVAALVSTATYRRL